YAKGKDARSLSEIVGEEALSETDKLYLKFGDDFENRYVNQGDANRSIEETLNLGWDLLSVLPVEEMKKVKSAHISKYGKWDSNGK
ncbi:ATP synthase beta subunit C-terminal domain-containing protein, partial [Acidiplasma aeolicum]